MNSKKHILVTRCSYIIVMFFITFGFAKAGALDPLEANEIEKVKQIQLIYIRENLPQVLTDTSIEIEVLLVERHPVKKGQENNVARLADIYTYDYGSNVLHQAIVNLETNTVLSLTQDTEIQLPLTENEIQKAVDILKADEELFKFILQEYKRITGQEYTNADQIEIKAFAFWGDSLPGVSNTESLKCGVYRCAQLLIYTPEQVAFEVSPVVNLSTKKVTQNINF